MALSGLAGALLCVPASRRAPVVPVRDAQSRVRWLFFAGLGIRVAVRPRRIV